jgi:hypothetical protein
MQGIASDVPLRQTMHIGNISTPKRLQTFANSINYFAWHSAIRVFRYRSVDFGPGSVHQIIGDGFVAAFLLLRSHVRMLSWLVPAHDNPCNACPAASLMDPRNQEFDTPNSYDYKINS